MLKKLSFAFGSVGLLLLASPLLSLAQTDDTPPTGTPPQVGVYCPQLVQTMQRGARDATTVPQGQVSELQIFLTDYYNLPDGQVVGGYFGPLTQRYVMQFQREQGLPTFGIVGSLTRAAIARVCGGTTGGVSFTATPTSGLAPLTVSFEALNISSGYRIDFGDGQQGQFSMPECPAPLPGTVNPGCYTWHASHTYPSPRTYTATLKRAIGVRECYTCGDTNIYETVSTATIAVSPAAINCPVYSGSACPVGRHPVSDPDTFDANNCRIPHGHCVADSTTVNAPSITGLDAPPSLGISQSGTWTVHVSVSGASSNLNYSVAWGDEGSSATAQNAVAGTVQTSGTFTHAYGQAGTYTPRFTVSNSAGSAQTSASVVVGPHPTACMIIDCVAGYHPSGPSCSASQTCVLNTDETTGTGSATTNTTNTSSSGTTGGYTTSPDGSVSGTGYSGSCLFNITLSGGACAYTTTTSAVCTIEGQQAYLKCPPTSMCLADPGWFTCRSGQYVRTCSGMDCYNASTPPHASATDSSSNLANVLTALESVLKSIAGQLLD